METSKPKKVIIKESHYCFTLNNPEGPLDFDKHNKTNLIKYAIWQLEKGKENGTPHYQGYIELSRQARLTQMKKIIPGAHFELRRGTRDQARDYCLKGDTRVEGETYHEYGEWRETVQGKRGDMDGVVEMANSGHDRVAIAKAYPKQFIRYHHGIDEYIRTVKSKGQRTNKTFVELYLGNPGTGKSFTASKHQGAYWKTPDKWWDGYTQQDVVVLDDFSGWLTWTQLLHIMDAYPTDVEVKNSKVNFNSDRIIITSNYHPKEWYSSDGQRAKHINALMRRFDKITICTRAAVYEAPGDWQERALWLDNKWYGGLNLSEDFDKPCWWVRKAQAEAEAAKEVEEAPTGLEGKEETDEEPAAKKSKLE